jgi:hypothetical protein
VKRSFHLGHPSCGGLGKPLGRGEEVGGAAIPCRISRTGKNPASSSYRGIRLAILREACATLRPIDTLSTALQHQMSTMTLSTTPESVVQRQLDAYNARDIDALMATYAEDAQQFEYPATLLASGARQVRERTVGRFRESNLHARLIKRIVMGQVVIDHEEVTRTFPEGPGKIELVAIYELRDGRIATARFIFGTRTLD